MTDILWHPSQDSQTTLHKVFEDISQKTGKTIDNYEKLFSWSVTNYEEFWTYWLEKSGIIYSGNTDPVLEPKEMPESVFFPKTTLNFAENLLKFRDDRPALHSVSESRDTVTLSYKELFSEVAQVRAGLDQLGVTKDDRVAGFVPNFWESVAAMLAATSGGATWSSCSPDFGVQGVLDRFGQIKPRVLFAANAYTYNGKTHDCLEKIKLIADQIPEIEKIIVVPFVKDHGTAVPGHEGKTVSWDDFKVDATDIDFVSLPFNHPLYIMYSSGTTGIPKCIVHGAGGTLLQHSKEHLLHCDLTRDDHMMYFTTCGWMMWNWLVSGLFTGCALTVYDGSPAYPGIEYLWKLIEQTKITHFGTSPKFLAACRDKYTPKDECKLDHLKVILSTGAPLLPEDFDWTYSKVKEDVQLSSISGGTDIISCFMLGNPTLPVIKGEIQCLGLGMDVAAFDDKHEPVTGEKGELVCRTPFPSAPIYFWNDENLERYKKAYFSEQPHTWFHGDFIEFTQSQGSCGGIVVHGRSDATLNPGGVRIGTAEIYRLVENLPEIADSIVVGQPHDGDVRVVLFVTMEAGHRLSEELEKKIKTTVRQGATPRHVPAVIKAVEKIPYTISGKKVELAVLKMIQGEEPKNKDALLDASALECFRDIL